MEVTRNFDLLSRFEEKFPQADSLAAKRNGKWIKFSTKQYRENVNNFSYGLLEMGFKPGDKIATVSNNRPEWNFVDFGMAQVGVVHIPIYPTISDSDYQHILRHSAAKILIAHNQHLYDRLKPIIAGVEETSDIYSFDKIEGAKNWSEIAALGKENAQKHAKKLEEIKASINPKDLVSIIYTSGTTGLPKGVMLSHDNFVSNVLASFDILPLGETDRILSFLPLCHVLERMLNYLYQYAGVSIYYAESIEAIGDNLKEIKPHGFGTVPRLLEKVYDKIIAKGKDLTGAKRKLFFWAVDLGLQYDDGDKKGWLYKKKLALANKLIFSKWREALGGNIKVVVSGGAALQVRLAKVFTAAGIPVLEGYGLTETSPVIAVNHLTPENKRFGTVGPILDRVQVKIAEDGEILTKGPNLMMGYYKAPEKTKEVIDDAGWFHTGDIGILQEGKFLKITDRKKEMFKLSGGKYVAPQVVENKMKESFFIEQLMIVGANEKFTGALISPNFEFLHDWAAKEKIHYRENEDLVEHPKVIARYQAEVDKYNKELGKTEQVKQFILVCEEWTPDNGELSPTQKLKRKYVADKYSVKLNRIYGR